MDSRSLAILILIVALMLHLAEEVRTGFRQRFPLGEMPARLFIGINVALYAFCTATLALSLRSSRWATPLAWFFALAMALNGLGHLGIMVVKREYYPGGYTAILLLVAAGYLAAQLSF